MKKFYDCGIDLGTTNSCIAKPNMNNTCTIVENKEGSSFTPSVVSITKKGMVRVGAIAKRTAIPGDVRKEFKRDMGTDTEYTFQSSGMKKTPVNLSAEVLGSLKRDFEARFIDQVAQNAVITVPAAFTLMQCEDTKNAAMEAGFQNVILLQEPIAAAIAYGAQPDAKEQYWLVFDYGGGTLDVSIISTKDDHLDNINSRGNNRMGGKDLDKLLYEKVILPKMQEEYNLPHGLDVISTNRIMEDVENCKKELSNKTSTLFIPENLGDISDEDDEPIDFSCSVSRQEFESVIRDVVLDAVSIARKSLTESGISEREIDRILLVGGSTFIPLVREELRKEFSIKLDSSLNPMTVVAEGAALFAASQMVEEGEAAGEAPGEEYYLDIEYEAITSQDTENVCGKIANANGAIKKVKIDCIAEENATGAIWSSGWSEVFDEATAAFDIDVMICTKNGPNLYRVSALDGRGSEVQLWGYLFEIVHKESVLKVMAPPMPHAIGVLANDGHFNRVVKIIDKNAKLPINVTETLFLDKPLDPREQDECNFVFYEGEVEQFTNPKANHHVGTITVRSDSLPRKIGKGAEVEISLSIDMSRVTSVSALLPDVGIELFTNQSLEGLGAKQNVMQRMTELEKEMESTEYSLSLLRKKGVGVGELYSRFTQIQNDYDKYLDMVGQDDDSVNVYIQRFYSLQTEVMQLEMESFASIEEDDLSSQVERCASNISRYGTPEQQKLLQEYRSQMDAVRDAESKKFIADKIDSLEDDVIYKSFDWWKDIYMMIYESIFARYRDNQKADYWKEQAREAIARRNLLGLKTAVIKLNELRIVRVGETNKMKLSDLRMQ